MHGMWGVERSVQITESPEEGDSDFEPTFRPEKEGIQG